MPGRTFPSRHESAAEELGKIVMGPTLTVASVQWRSLQRHGAATTATFSSR